MKASEYDLQHVYRLTSVAALGGILFGYDTAVISGAIGSLREYFDLDSTQTGWAVSNVVLGCIIGSYISGSISARFGRRWSMMLAGGLFAVSAIGSALATSFDWFVAYRLIGGVAVGITSVVSPMYISEISPNEHRGRTVSLQQLAIVTGQMVVLYVNYYIARGMTEQWLMNYGWRWMLGSELIPVTIFVGLLFFVPESPRWCVLHGQLKKAESILRKVSPGCDPALLIDRIRRSSYSCEAGGNIESESIFKSGMWKLVLIGCGLSFFSQIIGINAIMYYAPEILKTVSGSSSVALFQSTFIGIVFVSTTLLALYLIDRVGRRPMLIVGSLGCMSGMLIIGNAFYTSSMGIQALVGILVFIASFALSWGVCGWTLLAEIFPNRIRSRAMGFSICCQWMTTFLVSQLFPVLNDHPVLLEHFNGAFSFWFFGAMGFLAFLFSIRFVRETRNVPLEAMEAHMLGDKPEAGLVIK